MSNFQPANRGQKIKTIRKLETQLTALNKALAALPPRCDCETKYSYEEELALAYELAALWQQEFQKELATGMRASMDFMDISKSEGPWAG